MSAALGRGGRDSGNLELYAWLFMRLSGLVLLFIAVFHLLYMHLVIGVDRIDFQVIAQRWANPAWRLFDLALLVFAVSHGTNGARTVLDDVTRGTLNLALKSGLALGAVLLLLMGTQILFTFPVPPGRP